jgi:hypothetical protein
MSTIRQRLLEPLPPEGLKQHPTRSYLTAINSIYVTERFNDVFGLEGWSFRTEIVKDDGKWVVVQVFFTAGAIERSAFGGNDNEDIGDRYKGAVTDALTKIGSMLGVGAHVWKNENVPSRSAPEGRSTPTEHKGAPQPEPTEWLNIIDKRSGKYTDLGMEYCERVASGETSVKELRKQFKISRADAEALDKFVAQRPPQTEQRPSQPEKSWTDHHDDLPF